MSLPVTPDHLLYQAYTASTAYQLGTSLYKRHDTGHVKGCQQHTAFGSEGDRTIQHCCLECGQLFVSSLYHNVVPWQCSLKSVNY